MFALSGDPHPTVRSALTRSKWASHACPSRELRCGGPYPLVLVIGVLVIAARPGDAFGGTLDDPVGTAVCYRLFRKEPLVAVEVAVDGLRRLAGELRHQLIEPV